MLHLFIFTLRLYLGIAIAVTLFNLHIRLTLFKEVLYLSDKLSKLGVLVEDCFKCILVNLVFLSLSSLWSSDGDGFGSVSEQVNLKLTRNGT